MTRTSNRRILAIDPGTRHIGIAVLEGPDLVYHGVLTMPYHPEVPSVRRNTRALLNQLLSDFRPTVLALEQNSIGREADGSLLQAVVDEIKRAGRRHGIQILTKTASTVKKSLTGNGRATKEEVARACARCYPQLKAYLRQTAKWRTQYHGNMFDAVGLGLTCVSEPRTFRPCR
jgi:Holliday junction resolvasome RuvABC endonuclease subunit